MTARRAPGGLRTGQPGKKSAYHHGDLRRVLLDAAAEVIEEEGLEALSLRGIAARVGVSHAAPYRHFDDKDALVAAVAEAGFTELRADIARAAGRGGDGIERLTEAAVAYVDFARRRPGRYEVMFRGRRSHTGKAAAASEFAFGSLVVLVESAQSEGTLPESDAREVARAAWALVHGLAELSSTGRLGTSGQPALERLTRLAAEALIGGLARR